MLHSISSSLLHRQKPHANLVLTSESPTLRVSLTCERAHSRLLTTVRLFAVATPSLLTTTVLPTFETESQQRWRPHQDHLRQTSLLHPQLWLSSGQTLPTFHATFRSNDTMATRSDESTCNMHSYAICSQILDGSSRIHDQVIDLPL